MPDLEDRLTTWVDGAVSDVRPVTSAEVRHRQARRPSGGRRPAALVAIVAIALAAIAIGTLSLGAGRSDVDVHVDRSPSTTLPSTTACPGNGGRPGCRPSPTTADERPQMSLDLPPTFLAGELQAASFPDAGAGQRWDVPDDPAAGRLGQHLTVTVADGDDARATAQAMAVDPLAAAARHLGRLPDDLELVTLGGHPAVALPVEHVGGSGLGLPDRLLVGYLLTVDGSLVQVHAEDVPEPVLDRAMAGLDADDIAAARQVIAQD